MGGQKRPGVRLSLQSLRSDTACLHEQATVAAAAASSLVRGFGRRRG